MLPSPPVVERTMELVNDASQHIKLLINKSRDHEDLINHVIMRDKLMSERQAIIND